MKIHILGGGPGGLYFSTLWKMRHPQDEVVLFEQNASDVTWGFGVVFSDRALEFLKADDEETHALIAPRMEQWRDMTLNLKGEKVVIDGIGFAAIGRLELLMLLVERAKAVGVKLIHNRVITSLDEINDADIIIGADGVNSLIRKDFEKEFQSSLSYLDNKFVWYGTKRTFETLTQSFVETDFGAFNAHHYRYSPNMSTFIVECEASTWQNAGLDTMREAEAQAFCEGIFSPVLEGAPLVSNRSIWRNFPKLWCDKWVYKNMALLGDAAHTAHFSVGSGTRLALEDAIALVKALENSENIEKGLENYDQTRRPIAQKIVTAALTSAAWYDDFSTHMQLKPYDFAMSYITRSGRMSDEKLKALSPKFMEKYHAAHS
jgi:2-polyprenyl-6-methoxyphenol hydroxylase-like FAD-dependent oxidoreductase